MSEKKRMLKRIFQVMVLPVALSGMIAFLPCTGSCAYAVQDDVVCVDSGDVVLEASSKESKFVWGDRVFAPYVHLGSDNKIDVNDVYKKTGQKYYTFAFMNSNNGTPAWRGKYNYNEGKYKQEIDTLRANGGEIMISFGGASGNELALDITDVTKLKKAYQKVIDYYKLTWIDLDIEGNTLKDKEANKRRNKALVELQKEYPDVVYSYCLPADPRGLSSKAVTLLQDAKQRGVRVDVVNVMAMDYGDSIAPNPEGKMGYYAIKTAKETKKQLESMGYSSTKVGITAMIGVNDVTTEVFRVRDAKEVLEWAKDTDWVRYLGFWSVNRDNGNGKGKTGEASGKYSGISQSLFEFTNVFKSFEKKNPVDSPMTSVTSTNLALKKEATSSSVEEGTDLVAKNAVDGLKDTRWASEEKKNNPEWLQIDLGSNMIINKVDIEWEAAYARAYKVEVSTDGKTYKTVATETNNTNTTTSNSFASVVARYVRIYCTEKATPYGYSIYEVGVYNERPTEVNTNLALKKEATSSSVEEGTDLVAKKAVDGLRDTRWASEEKKSNPEWLQVDLGSVMTINRVDIEWEAAYARAYRVEVSIDGRTYKTVASVTNNTSLNTKNEFDVEDARYVRVYCTEKGTPYGYSIYEMSVKNTIKT